MSAQARSGFKVIHYVSPSDEREAGATVCELRDPHYSTHCQRGGCRGEVRRIHDMEGDELIVAYRHPELELFLNYSLCTECKKDLTYWLFDGAKISFEG
jgi:hypothetical protein